MSNQLHSFTNGFENALGSFVSVALGNASRASSNAAAQQAVSRARCSAAARSAESRVHASTAAQLRERLADAEEDAAFLRSENAELERKVEMLVSYLRDAKASGRLIA